MASYIPYERCCRAGSWAARNVTRNTVKGTKLFGKDGYQVSAFMICLEGAVFVEYGYSIQQATGRLHNRVAQYLVAKYKLEEEDYTQ